MLIVCIASMQVKAQRYYNYDVDGDGHVTSVDVTAIYNYLLGNVSGDSREYVDLGLPSGTLWATMNIGASSPEDYGDYFVWGEVVPREVYNWSNYKWCHGSYEQLTKYCTSSSDGYNGFVDNKTELDLADDVATTSWGIEWRMPSLDQIKELLNECNWQWTTRNGVIGRLATSKHNGATLFLPAAGYSYGGVLDDVGSRGDYWTRTLDSNYPSYAYYFSLNSGNVDWKYGNRSMGRSVRAVRMP